MSLSSVVVSVPESLLYVLRAADIPTTAEEADARLLTAIRKPQVVDIALGTASANVTVGAFLVFLIDFCAFRCWTRI